MNLTNTLLCAIVALLAAITWKLYSLPTVADMRENYGTESVQTLVDRVPLMQNIGRP